MTVKVSADLKAGRRQPDAAISYSEWLQRNIANITSLDISLAGPFDTSMAACLPLADILRTISSATQLCDLRLSFKSTDEDDDDDVSGVETDVVLPESFTGLAALTDLTTLAIHHGILSFPALSTISGHWTLHACICMRVMQTRKGKRSCHSYSAVWAI